jgi:hypothetical protein
MSLSFWITDGHPYSHDSDSQSRVGRFQYRICIRLAGTDRRIARSIAQRWFESRHRSSHRLAATPYLSRWRAGPPRRVFALAWRGCVLGARTPGAAQPSLTTARRAATSLTLVRICRCGVQYPLTGCEVPFILFCQPQLLVRRPVGQLLNGAVSTQAVPARLTPSPAPAARRCRARHHQKLARDRAQLDRYRSAAWRG